MALDTTGLVGGNCGFPGVYGFMLQVAGPAPSPLLDKVGLAGRQECVDREGVLFGENSSHYLCKRLGNRFVELSVRVGLVLFLDLFYIIFFIILINLFLSFMTAQNNSFFCLIDVLVHSQVTCNITEPPRLVQPPNGEVFLLQGVGLIAATGSVAIGEGRRYDTRRVRDN